MNWEIFSIIGYASIAIWLCMPVLWLVHFVRRPRGWLLHIAVVLGLVAFVLAKVNSETYVNRIQVDRSSEVEEQLNRQELARQAATEAREGEVAQIRFAEDAGNDFLDTAGMDESDLKYMESFNEDATPDWKKEKKQRSVESDDDSLESMIGATDETEGVDTDALVEEEPAAPILMSDKDKVAADRLDITNLRVIRWLVGLGVLIVVVDYFRRANVYEDAYLPLPLPSRWADAMTPRDPVTTRTTSPRRTLLEELQIFARRGESYVYVTDDADAAAQAAATAYRLPLQFSPVDVLNVADYNGEMDDDFVFESLWHGRSSFVVDSSDRAERMLDRFIELLTERKETRARVKQAVHVVWDVAAPIPESMQHRFANLGRATGYSLLLCRE